MSSIEFRVGAADPLAYACVLLRVAVAKGARLVVRAAPSQMDDLDARLWTFSQYDFLPHCRAGDALAQRTPVVLTDALDLRSFGDRDCLVNLAPDPASGWQALPRVIEIVGTSSADKQAGRSRFRAYREAGTEPTTMEIAA
ncbi:DNA polymerase III subunit chi [mine drainage metagenome]|uniref:DNA polymerase III subunit chi n=1 Tax=mine drainage metagenome TaxID=410659 RepID=A0A1J5SM27_9ZZZZ